MNGETEILYLKADRNTEVTRHLVTIGDVMQVECHDPELQNRVKKLTLYRFPDGKQRTRIAVSVLKVFERIHQEFPRVQIQNVGEADFIITCTGEEKPAKTIHHLKAVMVMLISFTGAAFSTMAFNNDVGIIHMFGQIYYQLTGVKSDGFTILEVMYCLGILLGILIFFHHFGSYRVGVDPTPIEVEMRLYENDLQTTMIDHYSRKGQELDVGTADTGGTDRA